MNTVLRLVSIVAVVAGGRSAFADMPLAAAIEQQANQLAPGAVRAGALVQGVGLKSEWSLTMELGKCYWLVGNVSGAKRLSLYLWGPDDHRVAESKSQGAQASLAYCPPYAGVYRAQAKLEGKGSYAVGTYVRNMIVAPPPPLLPSPAQAATAYPARAPYPAQYPVYAPSYYPPTVVIGGGYVGPGAAPPTECRMGSDGMNVCGYNCRLGANGHMYCSGIPNGQCALNSDGSFTCPGGVVNNNIYPPYNSGYGYRSNNAFQDNKGHRNDPCSNNLDCGFGLFCREDSDGYKMCM